MSNILDKVFVTKLNANWHAFEQLSVRDAITMLCPRDAHDKPGYAMDFVTILDDDGNPFIQYANPIPWDEWIKLPVREQDLAIETSRGPIRVPLVIICANYNEIPLISPKLTKDAIFRRDNYTCQYSGEKLPRSALNIDHVVPQDRGGRDTWENLVVSKKEINFAKSNRTNKEAGLSLIRKPYKPKDTVKVIRPEDLPIETREQVTPFVLPR